MSRFKTMINGLNRKALAPLLGLLFFTSCQDLYFEDMRKEYYTRNFIKEFGLIDPDHDWNMATQALVKVNIGDQKASSVKIYAKYESKYYLVADIDDVSGRLEVPVDVPKSCNEVMVKVDSRKHYGKINETIDCTVLSRAENDEDEYGPNNNPVIETSSVGDYTIEIQYTNRGNGKKSGYETENGIYQYFNTEQISPIVATTPWTSYYSLNTNGWSKANTDNEIGLLPESGVYNRIGQTLLDWLAAKENDKHEIVKDFKINTGEDGSFTIFPFYYGTNLQHELGVYLIDANGNPVLRNGTYDPSRVNDYTLADFVSFPILTDRKPGDLQIQPHYDSNIQGIRLFDSNANQEITQFSLSGVGDTYDLSKYVQIQRNGTWMNYNDYLTQYGDKFHSRVSYHIWVEDGKKPGSQEAYESNPNYDKKYGTLTHATVNKDGLVTALYTTKPHDGGKAWGSIAIATRMDNTSTGKSRVRGVSKDISYTVYTDHQDVTRITVDGSADTTIPLNLGETITLNVQLWNKYDDELDIEKYWDDIKVTTGWGDGIYEIWKDDNEKTIKVQGLKAGTQWPKIYIGEWDDDNQEFKSGSVVCYLTTNVVCSNHTFTLNGTLWPTSGSWESFFDIKYRTRAETTIHTESNPNNTNPSNTWGSIMIPNTGGMWDTLEPGNEIKISLSPANGSSLKVKLYTRDISGGWNELPDFTQLQSYTGDIVLTVTDNMCSAIKGGTDFIIQRADDEGFYLNSISIIGQTYSDSGNEEDKVYVWKSNGKSDAISALQTYYTNSYTVGTQTCSNCKESTDFSGANVSVSIPNDADYNNIKYTVTWTKSVSRASAGKPAMHKQPSTRKASQSTSRSASRDGAKPAMLTDNNDWQDVSSYWTRYLPAGEEVSCYPSNATMLARSRGYDITLTYKGNVYVGDLGMYLKVLGSNDIIDEALGGDNNGTIKYTEYDGNEQYIVYSQRRFNKDASGRPYPQVSALSFKHPLTKRTFLSFEDMLVTHAEGTGNYDWSRAQDYFFWEKSSDRDVNDMIFQITNHGGASDDEGNNVKETEIYDEGFPWIWVVEDLGSVDDFDFNDLVMRITSVTKKKSTPNIDTGTTEWTALYKKVTFTPLAAGGTLPLHIHLTDNTDGKKDYYLRPGTYNLTDATVEGIAPYNNELALRSDDAEYHRWFGYTDHSTMINTGMGPTGTGQSCVLYVKCPTIDTATGAWGNDGFNLNPLKGNINNKYRDNIDVYNTESIFFFVEVDGSAAQSEVGVEKRDDYYIANTSLGCAPQSFLIFDVQNWRWPRERKYILEAYPSFGKWVKDKDDTDWINAADVKKSLLY